IAEASSALDLSEFSCAICLDLLKDPVTINSGHSYFYSCPQCRQTFIPRPVLGRNSMLAEVVEKLKVTGLQAAIPAAHYAGPGDVECDVCTGRKHKAVKSCLVCLASYCETHLQPHYESPAFKKHKLTDVTGRLQDKVCSHHDKPLEVYCRTDQQSICYPCTMDEHKGHDTVSAAAGRTEIQKQMGETQREFQQRIQMREKELQELREAVGSFTSSAQSAVEDSERIFTEMIFSIERRRSEVTKLIRDQQKAAVSQAEGDMERLKQEIDELKRRHSELEQFSHTEDHIHFLQTFQKISAIEVTTEATSNQINSLTATVQQLIVDVGFHKEAIGHLESEVQALKNENKSMKAGVQECSRYSWRWCLKLHGVAEKESEDVRSVALTY
uniref:B box-type domain-containing protein n=1 Tax=Paramormyrops kingsleyae TaxID=1676925 RepID=A0A3B3QRU9_9TELE